MKPAPKPPLGWPPWVRPTLRRRLRYIVAYRIWRVKDFIWEFRYGRAWDQYMREQNGVR